MWVFEKLQIVSFISPNVCKMVVCPAWIDETNIVPEFPPIQVSSVCSQNSATLSAAGFVFDSLKYSDFITNVTACWADLRH